MSRELRICPGVGDRKCGAFLSTLDRDPHPTCARCRGKICTKDLTCDFCADWSAVQWERFTKKRSYKERKKSRPSGSVPSAPQTSPRAETSSGVSRPGTSSSSSSLPLGGQGRQEGSQGAPSVVSEGAPSPLARSRSSERGGSASRQSSGARSRFSFSFGSGRSGSCLLAADSLFPRLRLGCLSPILTARSTMWEFERDFGVLLPRVILPWFPFFRSRSTEG